MSAGGFYVHPAGLCDSSQVGEGTRIWAFSHVLPDAQIGRDVNLCEGVFVENDVRIGDRVTIKNNVAVYDGVRLEDDVFVGPGVVFTNDPYPRSKQFLGEYPETFVRKGASLGGGAVLLPGVEVGAFALVAAGAVVSKDVPPFTLVRGVPAREVGKVCKRGRPLGPEGCGHCGWRGAEPSLDMECSEFLEGQDA